MGLGIRSMVPVYKIRRGPSAAEKAAEKLLVMIGAPGRSLLCTWLATGGKWGRGLSIEQVKIVAVIFLTIDRKNGHQRTLEPSLL